MTEKNQTELSTGISLPEMLTFYQKGAHQQPAPPEGLLPALIHHYHHLDPLHVRYDFPLLLVENGENGYVVRLVEVIDNLLDSLEVSGDEGQLLKQHVLRVEAEIKSQLEKTPDGRLSDLWDTAAEIVLNHAEKKELVEKNIQTASEALKIEGTVVGCCHETSAKVFSHLWTQYWTIKNKTFCEELDLLLIKLNYILAADDAKTDKARDPEHLRASTANAEIDFEKLSKTLSESHLPQPFPEKQRQRLEETIETLKRGKMMFEYLSSEEIMIEDCMTVKDKYQQKIKEMITFFKAYRIAQLDLENKYNDEKHDHFFSDFDQNDFTETEWAYCPPILLNISIDELDAGRKCALIELLESDIPVKILLQVQDIESERWGQMALALNTVYVWQGTNASVKKMPVKGFDYPGPALYMVYEGDPVNIPQLSSYLASASAGEGRVFPGFTYDPGRGNDWLHRFELDPTPQYERDWSIDQYIYEEDEVSIDLEFTAADFLVTDQRYDFLPVAKSDWNENMIPVGEYLNHILNESDELVDKIPYILMIDAEGQQYRAILTRTLVEKTIKYLLNWRSLQELGGINNSHAQKRIAEEKERLEAEKQAEITEIEQKYEQQLNQNVGELTEVIINRIAAGLLSEGMGSSMMMAAPTSSAPAKKEAKPKEEEQAPAEPVEDEEDETMSFDDPYIDTPLCTSCNECTNRNGKMFAYNENKQAYIKDATAGTYKELVESAEKCPVKIIHPGKPKNPDEPGLDELIKRAEPFN